MVETYALYDEVQTAKWDGFVRSHPRGTPFHLSGWIRTIHEAYALQPHLYVLEEGGEIVGVLPCFVMRSPLGGERLASLPFSDYGGPLLKHGAQAAKLVQEVTQRTRNRVRGLEVRGPVPEDWGFARCDHYRRHILDLQVDSTKLLQGVDKRTIRYSIRKAREAGVEIVEGNTPNGLQEFYRLHKLTRKKHGVPSPPLVFFERLFSNSIATGQAFILLAVHDSEAIAAGVFLKHGESLFYKYNASDPQRLSQRPNHLLTWHAIDRAHHAGCRLLDFGRTPVSSKGLARYKEMWGARAFELPYSLYPRSRRTALREGTLPYTLLSWTWRSLPDALAEHIGPRTYRNLG